MDAILNGKLNVGRAAILALLTALIGVSGGCGPAGQAAPTLPPALAAGETNRPGAQVRAVFDRDCEAAVIEAIRDARQEVAVAIFSFTRRNIAYALGRAVKRGVTVRVKYDAGQEAEVEGMKQALAILKDKGVTCVPVRLEGEHASMHHKFMVIDRRRVLTGSYNYTVPATTTNCENLVVIDSPETAEAFLKEFESLQPARNR